jgi:hypothetical protein
MLFHPTATGSVSNDWAEVNSTTTNHNTVTASAINSVPGYAHWHCIMMLLVVRLGVLVVLELQLQLEVKV